MLSYLLTAVTVILVAVQSILQKQYTNKGTNNASLFLFPMVSAAASIVFFLAIKGFYLSFNPGIVGYAILFAISFAMALVGNISAIKHGPLSLTMLITSYSLVIPTLYGAVMLNETVSAVAVVGLVMLCVSLFMTNYNKNKDAEISVRWVISVIAAFVGNGVCSTVQKIQQKEFGGQYKSEFMIISMAVVFTLLLVMILTKDKANFCGFKRCFPYGALCGAANGVVNFLVMFLTGLVPNVILFPLISAGGIVIGYFVATVFYKEKLSMLQKAGYLCGTVSVVLLNL